MKYLDNETKVELKQLSTIVKISIKQIIIKTNNQLWQEKNASSGAIRSGLICSVRWSVLKSMSTVRVTTDKNREEKISKKKIIK